MTETAVLAFFQVFAAIVGMVFGSFVGLCIDRMPEDRSIVTPRSHCQSCGRTLGPLELVPVLSWIALRGRCRTCGTALSPAYPLLETLYALLGLLLVRRLVPDADAIDTAHVVAWCFGFGFLCLLGIAAYVDVRHWIIPDEVSIYAVPAGVAGAIAMEIAGYDGWLAIDWRASVTGALLSASLLATLSLVARWVMGREALGWGDVKLVAMIGAFVGPLQTLFLVLLPASLVGAIAGFAHLAATRQRGYLPFGPSLVLAAAFYVFFGDWMALRYSPGLAEIMGLRAD